MVEDRFEKLLREVVPDQATFKIAEHMFRDAGEERSRTTQAELACLRAQSRQTDRRVQQSLERAVRADEEGTARA